MSIGSIFTNINFQGIGDDGKVIALGSVSFNDSDYGFPAITYQDSEMQVPNEYPVPLSSSGKADIFIRQGTYDVTIKDSNGQVVKTITRFTPLGSSDGGGGDGSGDMLKSIYDKNDSGIVDDTEMFGGQTQAEQPISDLVNHELEQKIEDAPNDGRMYARQLAEWEEVDTTLDWDNITDKPTEYPPTNHEHLKEDITDFAHEHNDLYYDKDEFIIESTGTPEADMPVKTNGNGKLSMSFLDLDGGIFTPQGEWTPTAGTEYPDVTDPEETPAGSLWIISEVDPDDGYTFTTGDLDTRTADNGDILVLGVERFGLIASQIEPDLYYRLDGSTAITGDFAGGGFKINNIARAIDANDGVNYEQLLELLETKANEEHNHIIDDIDGLGSAMQEKADKSQVLTDVPEDALFTDTIYNDSDVVFHLANTNNPHSVSKADVGLGSVDNTSDVSKPVSTATATALALKINLTGGTFSGLVSGVYPSLDAHLSTKKYVDDKLGAGSDALKIDGSNAMSANLNMGVGNRIVGMGNGVGNTDAVTMSQLSLKEDNLGNPTTSGYVLSSTSGGFRSWVAAGGGDFLPLTGGTVTGNIKIRNSATEPAFIADNTAYTGASFAFTQSANGSFAINAYNASDSYLLSIMTASVSGKINFPQIPSTNASPSLDSDLATKKYVDDNAGGGSNFTTDVTITKNNPAVNLVNSGGSTARFVHQDDGNIVLYGNNNAINVALRIDGELRGSGTPPVTVDNAFATKKYVDDNGGGGVGVGQTWQNVFQSRNFGTTYTNSTGKPIQVNISMTVPTSSIDILTLNVSGLDVAKATATSSGATLGIAFVTAIVPAGGTYQANPTSGGTKNAWAELR